MLRRLHSSGWLVSFLCLAACIGGQAQSLDTTFASVPFAQWMAQGEHADLPWKVSISRPSLGPEQRLRVMITAEIDGKNLVKRPFQGELVFVLQFTDSANRVYQGHGIMKLEGMDKNVKKGDVVYTHPAIVAPGDYRIALGMLHSGSGEHNLALRTIHVAPMAVDPLPQSWIGIPAVEIMNAEDLPDAWFHPLLKGRLNLPLETQRAVHVDLVMNLPSGPVGGEFYRTAMADLIAALRTLSQITVRNGTLDISILDLTRSRVVFEQRIESIHVQELDWPRFKASLSASNPNTIDVGSLSNPGQGADFFRAQIARRVERAAAHDANDPQPVLIVLGSPMGFPRGADLHPVEPGGAGGATDYLVYYMLHRMFYHRPGAPPPAPYANQGRRMGRDRGSINPGGTLEISDSLAATLRPLNPHMLEWSNAEEFRQALATLLGDLARF